jgi:hypothetical protein
LAEPLHDLAEAASDRKFRGARGLVATRNLCESILGYPSSLTVRMDGSSESFSGSTRSCFCVSPRLPAHDLMEIEREQGDLKEVHLRGA